MKLGIMQPYIFPYLGYMSLIKHTDEFILLDEVQFIRHGWIERNRVLKQNSDWLYFKIPLIKEEGRDTLIKNLKINNLIEWKHIILAQLTIYKKIAPNYFKVINLLKTLFENEYNDIVKLNRDALKIVCEYLNIKTPIKIFSDMNLKIEEPNAPDEWALNICKVIGDVTEYWNPPDGQIFFDKKKFHHAGIDLKFHKIKLIEYDQRRTIFVPGLSILDVMLFNSVEEINFMLDNYELI